MITTIKTLVDSADSYKTYIIAGAIAVTVFAYLLGMISNEQLEAILGLLGAGGVAAVRHAISKIEKKV